MRRSAAAFGSDLLAAYGDVGFAYLVGHGIEPALVAEVFAASRAFHDLESAVKSAIALDERHRGYIAINTSTDRRSDLAEVTRPNQSASFMMMREAGPDDPDVVAGRFLAGPNQWPDLTGFRPVLERYHQAMVDLGGKLVAAFFEALGAADGQALIGRWFTPATTWLRLLHYPTQAPDPELYGSAPHVDYGAITFLAQDDVGGLQVQTADGAWIDVPHRDGAFVLNTGSMMVRWSNGQLKATPHRVINRSGRERYSIPFFYDPHVSTVVEPLPSCVPAGQDPTFAPEVFGDFLRRELSGGYDRHASLS